jgi:hypothetical protein
LCNALVSQILYGPDEWEESKLFHAMTVLVDEVPPTVNVDGHRHWSIYPYPRASYIAPPGSQNHGRTKTGDISLTWDYYSGIPSVNPVIGPDIDEILGYWVLLGPI